MPHAEDHFSSIAKQYAAGRFGYPRALFAHLASLCPVRHVTWDCATGSGQAALSLAEHFEHVVATDLSAELLALAPPHPRIAYRVAHAESPGLEPASLDLITVAQALHWFDLPRFWTEADRALKPGGVLAFWGYVWPQVSPEVDVHLDHLRAQLAPFWPEKIALLHERYASLRPPFAELPAPTFEIRVDWRADDYLAHLNSWSAVRYHRERTGAGPVATLAPALAQTWGAAPRPVRWPLALRLFRKAL